MKLKILKYPEPVLLKPGEPITKFDAALEKTVADMFETMYDGQGVGLAAPQVGISKRLIVIDLSMNKNPEDKMVLINPEVILSEGRQYSEEGCLSFPDVIEKVTRSLHVRVRAQNVKGEWFEAEGEELLARCFLHEIDHIDGIVFLDRMSPLKRNICARKIRKLQREGSW